MSLNDRNIMIFIEDNYQELEFWYPCLRMQEERANITVVGPKANHIYKSKLGYEAKSDKAADAIDPKFYDALIIPGGYAPDRMRVSKAMVEIVIAMNKDTKIIATICHAAWMLVSAKILVNKKATCYFTIKDDIINAGAHYLDQHVVRDKNLITSRQPDDLPYFCEAIIAALTETA